MSAGTYKKPTEQQVQRNNQRQRDLFSQLIHVFDPPLPEGVPARLQEIVASSRIEKGSTVLDVGTGTGILIPLIQAYMPEIIYACDLSETMLAHLKRQYPYAATLPGDVRDLELPSQSIDAVFLNACYPNIADKPGSFGNIRRMIKQGGRMVISHPMGKSFVDLLKEKSPFPLDDFPEESGAKTLLAPYGFEIEAFSDEPELYILVLVATKQGSGRAHH
ncbi:MAG: methyltransferase domain-containing protein [Deltaproteobacteria bacterium]|nr:methyltransferase domain-containing protein [Deltaproteobacteria bacterium]